MLQTGGSSSGIGTAANFWAGNVGTETSGSILSPSNQNMLAAIKPTVGRISRYGVIPITADQDTAGPMAKYVTDAAIMLGALESAAPDPNDPATKACTPPPGRDYTKFLQRRRPEGRAHRHSARVLLRPDHAAGSRSPRGGLNPDQTKVMDEAIAVLKAQGAIVVDVDIPSMRRDRIRRTTCCSPAQSSVLNYGMKRDFNTWLASLGPAAPVKTLTELREWNTAHEKLGAIKYGQSQLDISDEMDLEKDRARYEADRASDIRLGGTNGIDEALKANNLDALLFPGRVERRHRVEAGLSDRHRAVRHDSQHARQSRRRWRRRRRGRCDAPPAAPGHRSGWRGAVGRAHRRAADGATPPPPRSRQASSRSRSPTASDSPAPLQRADASAPGLRVRAGDEEAHAAPRTAVRVGSDGW